MIFPYPVPLVIWNLNKLHAPGIWSEFMVLYPLNGKGQLIPGLDISLPYPTKGINVV